MIPCFQRSSWVAVASAIVLSGATAEAQEQPADAPAPPPAAAEGAPARVEPAAPIIPERKANEPPMAPPTIRRVDASVPRKITGIVLTAIGAYDGFAGSVVLGAFAAIDGGSGFGFAYGLIIGGPLMAEGLVLTSIGIPLWVSGGKTVEKVDDSAESKWMPSVDVNAGKASATWHF